MHASAFSLVVLAMGASITCTAAAQQQPASIPTELALALIENSPNAYGRGAPKVIVGQAPAGMPASLTSADGAIILGGIEFPGRATVVLSFRQPESQVLTAYDKQLLGHGWASPPRAPNERGGFVSADFFLLGTVYCADSAVAMVTSVPAPGGGTYLRVQHMRNNYRMICDPRAYAQNLAVAQLDFPTLLQPVGMANEGTGGCSGSDRTQITARLAGAGEPLDILTHYVKQLETSGWKIGAPLSADGVAAASLSATDKDGVNWKGSITVNRVTSNEVDVTLQMMRSYQG